MEPWSKENIVQYILFIHEHDGFPSYERVYRDYPYLFDAALRFFGPWENALIAAGVICPPFDSDSFYDHYLCAWVHDSYSQPVSRHRSW